MAVGEGYDAGTAWLSVLPSFRGIDDELKKVSKQIADGLNKSLGDAMPDGVKASAKAAAKEAEKAGEAAGEKSAEGFAGHLADTLARRMRNAYRALPEVIIDADSTPFDKKLAKVRERIDKLRTQKLGVDISSHDAINEAWDLAVDMRKMRAGAGDARLRVDLAEAVDEVDAWGLVAAAGGEKLAQEAKRSADEWNRVHQSALDENERRQRKAAEEFVRLWDHAHQEDLRRTYLILKEQGRIHEDALHEDMKREWNARKELARLHEQAMAEDHKRTRRAAADAGKVAEQEFGRTWAGKLQAEISKAFQSLPDVGMRPARDAAEQAVKDIRGRLETLRNQRIGIDVDAGSALAEVATLRGMLAQLARQRTTVQVQADAIDAAAKLMLVERMAERLEGRRIDLRIEADASKLDDITRGAGFALSRLEGLTFLGLSLGTTLIPAAGAAAGAIGFIGTAAVSSAAGIGVLTLGFAGVGDAVKALNKHQQDAQKSAVAVAAAEDRVASATDAVSSAQRSLGNARANAAEGARRAAQQVADAERGVGDARREAAEASQRAARQVANAQRQLTDARREAAESARDAAGRLVDAQEDSKRADEDAREAREALTGAYRDAAKALADLSSAVKDNALDQRQANLDVAEAKADLDKILANPRATEQEREQARISYERRLQQINDLKREGRELAADQADAAKKGVAGSEQVVAAQKRIVDAERRAADAQEAVADAREAVVRAQVDGARRVADAQRAVAEAQSGAARAQMDGARRVADAERRVGDARRAQAEQQRQAAFSIVQAQQGVISAQRQLGQAIEKSSVAGGEALSNLRKAMDELSPAGQRFARFLFGLKPAFDDLQTVAAENLLPGVQSSIENLLPMLPRLGQFVGRVADSIGGLFDETTRFLTTDVTWRRFWSYTNSQTVPTLERLHRIAMNTATGVLGLFLAFTPFNDDLGGGLERLTERFANWSATLEGNQGFQNMLGYIRENSPAVIGMLGQLVEFVGRFVTAAAPIGSFVVAVFEKLFWVLNLIPLPVLNALVLGIATLSATVMVLNGAMRLAEIRRATFARISDTFTSVKLAGMDAADKISNGMDRVASRSDNAAQSMGRVRSAGSRMRTGLSTVGDFISGPWGAALIGAGLAVEFLSQSATRQKQKVEDLASALKLLGDAYRETKSVNSAAVKDIIAQSEELQKLIDNASLYGLAVADIAKAAAGEVDAQQRVVAALKEKRDWYVKNSLDTQGLFQGGFEKEIAAIDVVIGGLERQFAKTSAATRAQKALDEAQKTTANNLPRLTTAQFALGEKMGLNASRMEALTGLVNAFGNAQSTAAEKTNALRRAIELETGAKISAIEAEEAEARARRGVTSSVDENRAALQSQVEAGKLSVDQADKMSRSLSVNTEEGGRNRDALEAAAGAVRERYLADIESGMPMKEATQRFRDRIEALITNTKNMGFDEKKARELIGVYGDIDPKVTTVYTTKGFDAVFTELEKLQVAQWALANGVDPKTAWKQYKQNKAQAAAKGWGDGLGVPAFGGKGDGLGMKVSFFSRGGGVRGPGGKTSDSIPAWLSRGEFVQPAASVDYYGQGLMEAMRRRLLPRDMFPGFAAGGSAKYPFEVNTSVTRIPTMDEVRAAVLKPITASRSRGGIGAADMMRLLRAVFPGLALYSGFRPGSRTPSGNRSYHSMIAADGDEGRAVDLPPKRSVFNWIHDNFFEGTRELIWAGDADRNIWNGTHHRYSASLLANHGVAGQPNAHVHWAYDQGGYLPPGVSTVYNGTGKPEPVFTDGQFENIAALARGGHAEARETHHWHFKEAALDPGRLQAWADRRDAQARAGRRS